MPNFKGIESKWQKAWEKSKAFQVKESPKKKKFYVLEMLPYPSGSGLHLGHAFNYTIGDIQARFRRMQGFNVLYPMGYDSFGLPAENAAIKAKQHPKKFTEKAIKSFIKQQKELGLSYDWSRLIETHKPDYYKWDQWIFLQMFKKGLAYKKQAPVNWCPKCNTVLANEQVQNGRCYLHTDTEVQVKNLEQWFLKITDYADELFEGIKKLKDWPELVKKLQTNWINKSYGTEIIFKINQKPWKIFTTRPDTLFGVTFMVISVQHRELMSLVTKEQKSKVEKFVKKSSSVSEEDIDKLEKEGAFTGSYAIHPITKEKIPIYVGNFVLASYGSGMVMAVPAHDQRDFEFAKKYKIPIKEVVESKKKDRKRAYTGEGKLVNSPPKRNCIIIHGCPVEKKKYIVKHWKQWTKIQLEKEGIKTEIPRMPTPWNPEYSKWKKEFSKQKVNENTTVIATSCGASFIVRWLGDTQTKIDKLILVAPAKIPIDNNSTLSDFYNYDINKKTKNNVNEIIIFTSNDEERHLKSANLFEKMLDAKRIILNNKGHFSPGTMKSAEFPELIDIVLDDKSVSFNGLNSEKAKEEITKHLTKLKLGKKTTNFRLKDWLISRQRFWGTPIPIIYCDKCGIQPVPEKDLPVKLPDTIKLTKENALEKYKPFVNTKCPKCKGKAKRETDTMDTFANSSWYYLRYTDPKNSKKIFDKKKANYWNPIDLYIGGKEHACLHLIYIRFYTKFLRDLKLLNFNEPAKKMFNQGMLQGPDGQKMSKSKGNVVLPEKVSKKYGIDTARLFLVSIANPDKDINWSEEGVEGSLRFINRIFDKKFKIGKSSKKTQHKINSAIKQVTEDIEELRYNLAVIKIRELFDSLKEISKKDLESAIKLLSPFCPHIAEELWEKIGNKRFVSLEKWPKFNSKKINKKFDEEEKIIQRAKRDIIQIKEIKKINKPKIYLYTIPPEEEMFKENSDNLAATTGSASVTVFSNNDPKIHDPEKRAKKAKKGRPGIYIEP